MQFSLGAVILALAAVASAIPQDPVALAARQNQNRPVPSGACCVAQTSLKQDTCTAANGQTGRCVPGGNNCESGTSLNPVLLRWLTWVMTRQAALLSAVSPRAV
jgi:hypothetical protein